MTTEMDLYGKDKGNISLPRRLQPRNFDEKKLKNVIINTQKCLYDIKIAEINKKIQRLEKRNEELENILEDTDRSIQILQEEKTQEISNLNSQITAQVARVEGYKKQLTSLEESRVNDKSAHNAKIININEKYKNTRLKLISQLKLLSAKTNVLEDYKSMQQILEKKLDAQSVALVREKEQVAENLRQIERKFRIDIEILKKELYNRLLELAGIFQIEIAQHLPRSISKLLSENIAVNNMLSTMKEDAVLKKQDCTQYKNIVGEYKRRVDNAHSSAKQSLITTKLEKSVIAMLYEIYDKAVIKLSKLDKPKYLTEEQYVINRDNAKNDARKCEMRIKYLEISLYCEKEKLAIANYQKQRISDQLEQYLQMFYDIQYVLTNFNNEIED